MTTAHSTVVSIEADREMIFKFTSPWPEHRRKDFRGKNRQNRQVRFAAAQANESWFILYSTSMQWSSQEMSVDLGRSKTSQLRGEGSKHRLS